MDKKCIRCGEVKPEHAFPWKNRARGKRAGHCLDCQKIDSKAHYVKHRATYIDKARRFKEKNVPVAIDFLRKYLQAHPCVDCGESDILVLQFDHIEDDGHNTPLGSLVYSGLVRRIKQELSKCEIRCANCHQKRHILDRKTWRTHAPVAQLDEHLASD